MKFLRRSHHQKTTAPAIARRKFAGNINRAITLGLVLLLFGSGSVHVFADSLCATGWSHLDCQSVYGGWTGWAPETGCSTSTVGAVADTVVVPPGQNSGIWNSGLNPPYTLEEFMTELLKDIAQKRGVPATDAVTQQHVIALLAFAWGEGGNGTNNDFWNPFNTGINAPDLTVGGVHVGNGVQAFKSFDAGVEATARVMTGSTQGRLGVVLTDPSSTAMGFLSSWLDFAPKPPYQIGHYPWAEASDPSSIYYQPDYQQKHVQLIAQVTKNYNSMASTIMRGQASDPSNKHDTSKLMFQASSHDATDGSLGGCADTGLGTGAFFDIAKAYAWSKYTKAPYCVMKPEYTTAVAAAVARIRNGKNDYVGGGSLAISDGDCSAGGHAGIDCGGFVTRVFRDSGADPNYNKSDGNVIAQHAYVLDHPELYKRVTGAKKSTDLQPGDIFFASDFSHTYIYVGPYGYPGYNSVSASFSTSGDSWRTPMASKASNISSSIWYRPLFTLVTTSGGATAATPSVN